MNSEDKFALAWTRAGGFFHRFDGQDHACMPIDQWRQFGPCSAVPAGFVLVPESCTQQMADAAFLYARDSVGMSWHGCWKAMLAAAPRIAHQKPPHD